jgi:putative photosynthetic complex assembly protein
MSEAWSYGQHTRNAAAERPIVGRKPIILMCSLALGTLIIAAFARFTGIGVVKLPDTPIVASRALSFRELPTGTVEVRTAPHGELVQSLSLREGGGFIQTVMRGMNMDRAPRKIGPEAPYTLARHKDGRLMLHDPATGRRQTVDTFGHANTEVFARLLPKEDKNKGEVK